MSFIEDLSKEVEAAVSAQNAEVVVSAFRECLSRDLTREIRSEIMRRLAPTCEFRKTHRKLRKWFRRQDSIRERLEDDWWYSPSNALATCRSMIEHYQGRLAGQKFCGSCLSCAVDEYGSADDHNTVVRNKASGIAEDVRGLVKPILTL